MTIWRRIPAKAAAALFCVFLLLLFNLVVSAVAVDLGKKEKYKVQTSRERASNYY